MIFSNPDPENYKNSIGLPAKGHWGTCPPPSNSNNFIFSSLWSKSDSQVV